MPPDPDTNNFNSKKLLPDIPPITLKRNLGNSSSNMGYGSPTTLQLKSRYLQELRSKSELRKVSLPSIKKESKLKAGDDEEPVPPNYFLT